MSDDLDSILRNIGVKESREDTKELIRQFKRDGMTKNEIEALYIGIGMMDKEHGSLTPLMLLWIKEVYEEK